MVSVQKPCPQRDGSLWGCVTNGGNPLGTEPSVMITDIGDNLVSRNRSILEERILAKSLELQIDRYVVHEETVNVAEIIVLDLHMVEKIVNLF